MEKSNRYNEILIKATKDLKMIRPNTLIYKKLGVSKSTVSQFLNRKRGATEEFMRKFSEAFNYPVDFGYVPLESENTSIVSEQSVAYRSKLEIENEELKMQLSEAKAEIDALKNRIMNMSDKLTHYMELAEELRPKAYAIATTNQTTESTPIYTKP